MIILEKNEKICGIKIYKCLVWRSMSSPGEESPLETGSSPSIWLSAISNQYSFDNFPIEAGIVPVNWFKFSELYGRNIYQYWS